MTYNTARERYRLRHLNPQGMRELRKMRARDRDAWLANALLPEHAPFFLAQVIWHQRRLRGETGVTISMHVGSA